jgi:hypothetical protein
MAIIKGVNERVHLPLYDSLFVRPARQLRGLVSSNVLKFFVNIQGKTKLETNMQSSSLLPHWNTFEVRALRVVISDLPAIFPPGIEECLSGSNGTTNGYGCELTSCLGDIQALLEDFHHQCSYEQVADARASLNAFSYAAEQASGISEDIEACLGILRRFSDPNGMGQILEMQRDLRSIKDDLSAVLKRTRVTITKAKEVSRFLQRLEELETKGEEYDLLRRIPDAKSCLDSFVRLTDIAARIKDKHAAEIEVCVTAAERFVETAPYKTERLNHLKSCLTDAAAELNRLKAHVRNARAEATKECLNEVLADKLLIPIDEQLFSSSAQILAKLIYNSVTTLIVGEKVMIQMPTWFFPAGAGPYSEDGQVVTHGVPTPQATFHFAEPVFIDTQQNFRIEIEFPEAGAIEELRRIYGPFFIWVVLDGYMTRDVQ